jgi:hypothetical protein
MKTPPVRMRLILRHCHRQKSPVLPDFWHRAQNQVPASGRRKGG